MHLYVCHLSCTFGTLALSYSCAITVPLSHYYCHALFNMSPYCYLIQIFWIFHIQWWNIQSGGTKYFVQGDKMGGGTNFSWQFHQYMHLFSSFFMWLCLLVAIVAASFPCLPTVQLRYAKTEGIWSILSRQSLPSRRRGAGSLIERRISRTRSLFSTKSSTPFASRTIETPVLGAETKRSGLWLVLSTGDPSPPLSTKVDTDVIHVINDTQAFPFAYCKRSKTGGGNGLGTRLIAGSFMM